MTDNPSLDLTLRPETGGTADGVDVAYTLRGHRFAAGDALCRLPATIVGIPGAAVGQIEFRDDSGVIPASEELQPQTPSATYRRWLAGRDTEGAVEVRYFAPVRVVTTTTNNGPLFDLRAESGGVSGAGVTFLALPDTSEELDVSLTWDLSRLSAGARGVSSFGEGDGDGFARLRATTERLAFSFYLAGPVRSWPERDDATFSMHWLTEPSFDTAAVAGKTERIYGAMCAFFREPEPGHRVFVRQHPYRGNGGTAFSRSFVFGYCDHEPPAADSLTMLLAHETAHNWPRLDGEHAETAWYSEGSAEYYSILLPYRSGITTEDEYLLEINDRAHGYYTNPLMTLSNAAAGRLFWKDNRAQRVPYGRGLFYLLDVNHQIATASSGRRSLDDLVLAVLDRQRAGERVGVPEWHDLVAAELGSDAARAGFEAMAAGEWIVPAPDALGASFTRREVADHVTDAGFDLDSLVTGKVSGLVPGSAAEQAGVREGDLIRSGPNRAQAVHGGREPIELTLQRDGLTLTVTYNPWGAPVRSYEWIRP
jgi:M61 glycyl aminopeptidase